MSETQAINADEELEQQIKHRSELLDEKHSPEENRANWLELTRLHALRSPEQVERMEREILR